MKISLPKDPEKSVTYKSAPADGNLYKLHQVNG